MAPESSDSQPSELVYVPEPSWYPLLIAAGLAAVLVSVFTWWPYGVVGAVVALFALRGMVKASSEDFDRLPRHQRITAGAIPAVTLKRPRD